MNSRRRIHPSRKDALGYHRDQAWRNAASLPMTLRSASRWRCSCEKLDNLAFVVPLDHVDAVNVDASARVAH